MVSKHSFFFFLFLFIELVLPATAQTIPHVPISLQQADSTFLDKNLLLLAEKCNVDAARAQVLQSKLWSNPSVSVTQSAYNGAYKTNGGKKWFDFSQNGEMSIQVQQLILLAGKRNKQIKIAELSAQKEEQLYFDLLRTLKYSLHSGFYNIYYLQQSLNVYDKEIDSLSKLIEVFQTQYEKGYVSKKEILRLKSDLLSLQSEKSGLYGQLVSALSDFNVLLHTTGVYYTPAVDQNHYKTADSIKLESLLDTAYNNRYDLKAAQLDASISQTNYRYQKSMAVPDLMLMAGWDRQGSFIRDYNYVGVQVDLPFFNRNQGNIKTAKLTAQASEYKMQSAEDQVKADVLQAYTIALDAEKNYHNFDHSFISDLDTLNQEMLKNYEKKNISLIEFLDYYEAYKDNALQINGMLYNRINALEGINYSVGKEVTNR
jgi:outer membrane protein, heavy metal efflux system